MQHAFDIADPANPFYQTWSIYTDAWKASTDADKQALFAQSLDLHCEYNDPLIVARGWQELMAYMHSFHQQVPGGYFQTKTFMTHHQQSIAIWDMLDCTGNAMGEGVSYGLYNDQGKLLRMTGFFATP